MTISQSEYYRQILSRAPLETDARAELARIIAMIDQDPKLSFYTFAAHLYPFLTHSSSAPQTLFVRHLEHFKGDLLRSAYAHATEAPHCKHDAGTIGYDIERIERIAQAVGQRAINSTQLAFALTLFNLTEVDGPIDNYKLDDRELSRVIRYEYESGNRFWSENGVSLENVIELSRALLRYDGSELLTPEDIGNRFVLSLAIGPNSLVVRPIERWGTHLVGMPDRLNPQSSELWLPANALVSESQLGEFEELLSYCHASEADWQHFSMQILSFSICLETMKATREKYRFLGKSFLAMRSRICDRTSC